MSYLHPTSDSGWIGVLGGMGPLASAEFLKTIYEHNLVGQSEQAAPQVLMYSDPTMPDRTQVLLDGDYAQLLERLIEVLYQLCDLNATKIVICCLTAHWLLPKFPAELQDRIVSMVDIVLEKVITQRTPQLLLCTSGARQLNVFAQSSQWQQARKYILFPDEFDQHSVHKMIYQIKTNALSMQRAHHFVRHLSQKYTVNSVIAGCTELHLLSKFSEVNARDANHPSTMTFLDPLTLFAQSLALDSRCKNNIQSLLPST